MMIKLFRMICLPALASMMALAAAHPADENPDPDLTATTRFFRQDRFGIYLHWGVYSALGQGENAMKDMKLTQREYDRVPDFFNPTRYSDKDLVGLVKASGANYMVFSVKSRDGFALWNSKVTDFNIMDRTPLGKDVTKELTEECHRMGMRIFYGFTPTDWRQAALYKAWQQNPPADESVTTPSATEMAMAQLTELSTHYTRVDGFWLDGLQDEGQDATQWEQTLQMLRKNQPSAVLGISNLKSPFKGQDFQIKDASALVTTEFTDPLSTVTLDYTGRPAEISDTVSKSPTFRLDDMQVKGTRELVHNLVRAAGNDANYLLHVGVMPDGRVPWEVQEPLRRMGLWIAKNGESIFATRGGPIPPQPWGVTTHRRNKIYVHVLDPEVTTITLSVPTQLRTARYLSDDAQVIHESTDSTATLVLRKEYRTDLERVVVLETKHYN